MDIDGDRTREADWLAFVLPMIIFWVFSLLAPYGLMWTESAAFVAARLGSNLCLRCNRGGSGGLRAFAVEFTRGNRDELQSDGVLLGGDGVFASREPGDCARRGIPAGPNAAFMMSPRARGASARCGKRACVHARLS